MDIRRYERADAAATQSIFVAAVRQTSTAHYSPVQVEDWASEAGDLESWAAARAVAETVVATRDGQVVGFADLVDRGHVDMLFVDPRVSRQGIATALLAAVIARARAYGVAEVTTFASLTSRPVFARAGFVVRGERYFGEGEAAAKTYEMSVELGGGTARHA